MFPVVYTPLRAYPDQKRLASDPTVTSTIGLCATDMSSLFGEAEPVIGTRQVISCGSV
jgi:hypothetical protein